MIFVSVIILSGCNNKPKKVKSTSIEHPPTADKSKTSLDWNGTYKGVLPCADCEGIETVLILDEDLSYIKKVKYMGKDNTFKTSTGNFIWLDDGNIITLDEDKPNAYRVGENQLFALDMNDARITGNLQDRYILKKLSNEDLMLDNYWKLVSVNGKILQETKNKPKEAHIMFIQQDSMVVGSGGCNRLRGGFSLEYSTNRLSFKKISTTMMACDNLDTEAEFLKVLENVSQYKIIKDSLMIFNTDMSSHADFIKEEKPD